MLGTCLNDWLLIQLTPPESAEIRKHGHVRLAMPFEP